MWTRDENVSTGMRSEQVKTKRHCREKCFALFSFGYKRILLKVDWCDSGPSFHYPRACLPLVLDKQRMAFKLRTLKVRLLTEIKLSYRISN